MQAFILRQWTHRGIWAWLWSPLSLLVCLYARLKRTAYQRGIFKQTRLEVPVIVVGNLSVGGSGKTPLVDYLARRLREQGWQTGIVSRGYRGRSTYWPRDVTADSDPEQVGDEPVMLARLTACPVVAGPNRVEAAQRLITEHHCDIVLSDDGFQHLQLARDIDILVFDTAQGEGPGNGWCLPSGPLREPASTRAVADMLVWHGLVPDSSGPNSYSMQLAPGTIYALNTRKPADLASLRQQTLHAVAGIGRPTRFFQSLRTAGLKVLEHPFDDHHQYTPNDLDFDDSYDLITTEKDAIKLQAVELKQTVWVLPVHADLGGQFDASLLQRLNSIQEKA